MKKQHKKKPLVKNQAKRAITKLKSIDAYWVGKGYTNDTSRT